jgi:hypothetical protein
VPAPSTPPLFRAATLDEAKALAAAQDQRLVVSAVVQADDGDDADADAVWRSAEVRAAIEGRALAVRIDLAADRAAARALNVRAVPTTIAFRAGKQEERLVGVEGAPALARWLGDLEGRTAAPDAHLRWSAAKMRLDDRRHEEATPGYLWIWNNIPGVEGSYDTGFMGARHSSVIKEVAALVRAHAPARAAFGAIRDAGAAAAGALDLGGWFGPRVDWILLNRALEEEDRTLRWLDAVKKDAAHAQVLEHVAILLRDTLEERGRWADIGRLIVDPLASLAQAHEMMHAMDAGSIPGDALAREYAALVDEEFRREVVVLYAGLRAAGRASEAKALRDEALLLDPSEEMRLALERAPVPLN